jgi:hypothetical protein
VDDPAGGCRGRSSRCRGVEVGTGAGVAAGGEGEREPRDEAGGRKQQGEPAHVRKTAGRALRLRRLHAVPPPWALLRDEPDRAERGSVRSAE